MLSLDSPLQLGNLCLSRQQSCAEQGSGIEVPLGPAGDLLEEWIAAGGLLAAQAMAPGAAWPLAVRQGLSFLAMGPGAAMAAYIAVCMEAGKVEVVLHPNDVDAFQHLVTLRQSSTEVQIFKRIDDAPDGAFHNMVALGCDGQIPQSLQEAAPLVKRMRTEGQLLLYGVPATAIKEVFDRAAQKGMSLRAMGVRDGLAFVCGSLEHRNHFG